MNTRKIFRFFIFSAAVLVLGTVIGYLSLTRVFPVLLSANMEKILARHTGCEVSIGRTTVQVLPGASVTLDAVLIGTEAGPLIDARKIHARVSLWDAFLGRLRITSVTLEDPRITLDAGAVKRLAAQRGSEALPVIVVRQGSVTLPDAAGRPILESVNGAIEPDKVELSAYVLGGKTRISARRETGWKGTAVSRDVDLSRLAGGMRGVLAGDVDFRFTEGRIDARTRVSGKAIVLPWSQTGIESLAVTIGAKGDGRRLALDEISLVTPVVRVTGTGQIARPDRKMDAAITLDLSSGTFDYETVVSLLPTKNFDPWLETLLASQIRGGSSRFTSAHYEGTIGELVHFTRFIDHIVVVQEIMGQSFAAKPGSGRITGITGRAVYGKGDIVIQDLSGTMNGSVIDRVTLTFPGIILPDMRIGVDVKVDMPARDFLDTWNATGMPEYALDLFAGISGVKRGAVAGDVSTYYDEAAERPFVLKGSATLKDCDYRWGTQAVQGHSGTVSAQDFDSPLEISSQLTLGGSRIRSLAVVLDDPFGRQESSFRATVDGIPASEKLSLGKGTTVQIEGTGTGPEISASADVRVRDFELFGAACRVKGKPIQASATATGRLWPEVSLDFSGKTPQSPPEALTVSGHVGKTEGAVRIAGAVNLGGLEAVQADAARGLSGEIRGGVNIGWGKKTAVNGSVVCKQAALPVNGSIVTVDGPILMSGDTLKSRSLRITRETMEVAISNGSLALGDRPVLRGDLTVKGMEFPLEGTDFVEDLRNYTARGHVRLLDFHLYGIPMSEADAEASLEDGVLTLADIRATGESGTTQGFLTSDLSSILSFDITFALLDANINQFFNAMSEEQDWIRGTMDLSGRLYGGNGSVSGTVNLVAKNGRLKKYALASRIFALLNIYKIVRTLDIELTSRNFPYNVITSTFHIKDGVMRFDDFFLDSNSLQLSAAGTYALKTRDIDAVLGIQPFETIDKAISWIPLLGWVLTGDNGRLLVVSLKVAGQIDDPTVQIAPIETISTPIRETWARALDLPSEILNGWRRYLPKKK